MSEPRLTIYTVPMLDTGLGREAGFRDDAELIEAARRKREAMPPVVREIVEAIDRRLEDAAINGDRPMATSDHTRLSIDLP